MHNTHERLATALQERGLHIDSSTPQHLTVSWQQPAPPKIRRARTAPSRRTAPPKRTANLNIGPLLNALSSTSDALSQEITLQGFADGVFCAVAQPWMERFNTWSFPDVAGDLTVLMASDAYLLGTRAAGLEDAWTHPFLDGLLLTYHIDTEVGRRVLTQRQMDQWDITTDRMTCAARSLLYHRTRYGELEPYAPGVLCYRFEDQQDASRAIVLGDLDFNRIRNGVLFSTPHPNLLLLCDQGPDAEATLRTHTLEACNSTNRPLSPHIMTFDHNQQPTLLAP